MLTRSRLAALTLLLFLMLGPAAQSAAPSPQFLLTGKAKFALPDGQTVIGQVLFFDGQMYSVQLPDGAMMVRKDFLVSVTPVRPAKSPLRPKPSRLTRAFFGNKG